ncbi:unnamed protein product [Lathyrus oleraceus]
MEHFWEDPYNRSVLIEYADHVTYRLWYGKDCPTLKVTSHELKLKNFPKTPMPEHVRRIVQNFELLAFADCSLTMLDASLLTAFVDRWHKETSSFHLPFGKITITLDDVSSLFHLPIVERFLTATV